MAGAMLSERVGTTRWSSFCFMTDSSSSEVFDVRNIEVADLLASTRFRTHKELFFSLQTLETLIAHRVTDQPRPVCQRPATTAPYLQTAEADYHGTQ